MDILVKDLKVFSAFNEDLFKEITQPLIVYGEHSSEVVIKINVCEAQICNPGNQNWYLRQ